MPDYLNLEEDPLTLYRRFEMTGVDRPARPHAAHVQDKLIARFERRALAPGNRQAPGARGQRLLTQRLALARMLLAVQNDTDVTRAWNRYLDLMRPLIGEPSRQPLYHGKAEVIQLQDFGVRPIAIRRP